MSRQSKDTNLFTRRTATYSPCQRYRYTLKIVWEPSLPVAVFLALNPSTATEFQDDPTLRKVQGFAHRWGCGGVLMLNIFAFRATDPRVMKMQNDPVGPENTVEFLASQVLLHDGPAVAAWGKHGAFRGRGPEVAQALAGKLMCLRMNGDGSPEHPLYVPYEIKPVQFSADMMAGAKAAD